MVRGTHQRRRGEPIRVFKSRLFLDKRGNDIIRPVEADYHNLRASIQPLRGSRAEVPGQQEINIYHLQIDPDLPGVDLWAQVEWNGQRWDIVAPPVLHIGSRHTRHWSLDIRLRPNRELTDELVPEDLQAVEPAVFKTPAYTGLE